MIYSSLNTLILDRIPSTAKRVLDIGCGSGTLGREIKKRYQCEVVGITYSKEEAALAEVAIDQVLVRDLNHFEIREAGGLFDCVICSHVLEHLNHPETLLNHMHEILAPGGCLLVGLPNILFWKQRLLFLQGKFKYTEEGILDKTHFRFYDWETAHALLRDAGYTVTSAAAEGMVPLRGFRSLFPGICRTIDSAMGAKFPGLFGMQFVFACKSLTAKK